LGIESISLEGLEISELLALKEMVSDRIDEVKKENKKRLMKMIETEAAKMGVPMDELFTSGSKATDKRRTVKVKYRDSHGNAWTGRGNAPGWLLEHLGAEKIDREDPDQVKKLDALLVDED
jgi:DNA-binding protein H-NS